MDIRPVSPRQKLIRAALVLLAVFFLLQWAGAVELLSGFTKPVVIGLLHAAGIDAVDAGTALLLGSLRVPWTGDCAGLNILALLLMVSLWVHRDAPLGWKHAGRLALALPAAFAANIARVFTVIGYRALFAPAVESAAAHYLFGFLWVLPVMPLVFPKGRGMRWADILLVASALALVAPLVGAPGGTLASVCALLALADSRHRGDTSAWHATLWIAAALPIAFARMESLWLPWVLLSPFFHPWRPLWRSALRAALCVGTVIPLTLHAPVAVAAWTAALAAVVASVFRLLGREEERGSGSPSGLPVQIALSVWLLFPFVAMSAGGRAEQSPPPPGVMSRRLEPGAHELGLPGLRPGTTVVWYEPHGDGRHHSLPVCMRFRGIDLEESGTPRVMTDGKRWYREFFFQDGRLAEDYPEYLRRTFWPLSHPGVHVIVTAPASAVSPADFLRETDAIALRLAGLAGGASAP